MEDIEERRSRPFTIFCMLLLGTQGGRSHLSCGLYKKRPSAHTQRKKDAAAQFPQRGPVAALPAAAASWELTETHRHHVDVVSLSFFILLIAHYPNEMDFKATPKIALPPGLGIDVAPSSASTPTPLDRRPPRKSRKPSSSMPPVVWPPSNAKQFKIDSTVSRSNYSSNCCSIKPSGSSGSSLRGVTQRPSGKWVSCGIVLEY